MAIGEVFRFSVVSNHLGTGEEYINVHHFEQVTGLVQASEGADLARAWNDEVKSLYVPLLSSTVSVVSLEVRKVGDPSFIYEETVSGGTGTSTGDMLPPFVAPVVSWRTGLAGRSRRGRTYMPPTAEAHQNGGILASSYLDPWEDWATAMLVMVSDVNHGGWALHIRSETLNDSFLVTSFLLRSQLARQGRRSLGVGS